MLPEITRIIAKIHDAGFVPDAWPEALKALTDALGVAGAACIVSNKTTSRVDWVCFSGLSAELQCEYINHYAPLDPLLTAGEGHSRLDEAVPTPPGFALEKKRMVQRFRDGVRRSRYPCNSSC
jgi:hypothetical protein